MDFVNPLVSYIYYYKSLKLRFGNRIGPSSEAKDRSNGQLNVIMFRYGESDRNQARYFVFICWWSLWKY